MADGKNIALAGGVVTVIGIVFSFWSLILGVLSGDLSARWGIVAGAIVGLVGFEVLIVGLILWVKARKKLEGSDLER